MATRKIVMKPDTSVSCPTCSCEIPVLNTESLRREFSVPCPNCGARKLYQMDQIHDHRQDAETTQTSRSIQFGMRREIDCDRAAGSPAQEKSQKSGFVSWLLQ
jgi:phage terminase large subunit GpA-like protein